MSRTAFHTYRTPLAGQFQGRSEMLILKFQYNSNNNNNNNSNTLRREKRRETKYESVYKTINLKEAIKKHFCVFDIR